MGPASTIALGGSCSIFAFSCIYNAHDVSSDRPNNFRFRRRRYQRYRESEMGAFVGVSEWSQTEIELCFLAIGGRMFLGCLTSGKVLGWDDSEKDQERGLRKGRGKGLERGEEQGKSGSFHFVSNSILFKTSLASRSLSTQFSINVRLYVD
ncbi:hypothetical protein C8R41DRAFT_156176 [Lentinula lateritia]|uniref:Uncharacterized protein n=1 Tax=Lentinula lateritia TaxID=40482 RepID=A0ABQ8V2D5_9AGAR|nr:hypothetical protein C8R41DRAFT_156176 [Lentinula lateritia]